MEVLYITEDKKYNKNDISNPRDTSDNAKSLINENGDKLGSLMSSCRFCYSECKARCFTIMNLPDLEEIIRILQLDHDNKQLSKEVCEDCYSKFMEINRFRLKCQLVQKQKLKEFEQLCDSKDNLLELTEDIELDYFFQDTLNDNMSYNEIVPFDSNNGNNQKLLKITDENRTVPLRRQEKNFLCDLCGKIFWNSQNIRKHKQNVHLVDFNGAMLSCDLCSVERPTKRLLYKHMKSVHIVKLTLCKICGKVFRTRELWQKHNRTHNASQKIEFCPYCPHRPGFKCRSALQKHLKRTH